MTSSSANLIKDLENFRKRGAEAAASINSNEKRPKIEKSTSQKPSRSKPGLGRSKTSSDLMNEYYPPSLSSKTRLHIRAKIIEKLQERFLSGCTDPFTLDEIIQETELTVDPSDKYWLASEALLTCDKIDVKKIDDVDKFVYKPPLELKGGKKQALLNLLKTRYEKCEGALNADDVRDTIPKPKADHIIDNLIKDGQVVKVTSNKKEVLFYNDPTHKLRVHPDFVEAWRRFSVEGFDEKKILEFLDKQGHYGLTKNTPRPQQYQKKTSKRGGRRPDTMKHNQHIAHQLEDYSNTQTKKQ